jgi:hypothetical protein
MALENGKSVHIFVYDLQCKIYYHAGKNETGFIRHYQQKLIKSMEARLRSLPTVSQDNRGKVAAGIELIIITCHDQIHSTKK